MWLKKYFGRQQASLEQLGRLETELMERAWARGQISVRDLHQEMAGRLAYTTLMTTMDRLYKKGLLQRRKDGKAYIYSPAMSEREYQESLTQHFFGMMLSDSRNSNAVLSRFVDAVSEADSKMLNELEQIVKAKRRNLRRSE
ncbi:MAG TPA: BlaI/MecI/CopY family transcriptional regulator [Candidatus Acidoferrales bacterium]|jgi:predicted transcriptional regulator|nr:BlaI/MecI/CopY family transcriptional regulator [Candidatus Acidoferrales bacterium]